MSIFCYYFYLTTSKRKKNRNSYPIFKNIIYIDATHATRVSMANALDEEKNKWNNKVFKGMMNREKS